MATLILHNHDQATPIGFIEAIDGRLHFRFSEDVKITKDMAFQIFGNAGLQILKTTEEDGATFIQHGCILEWSFSPVGATPEREMIAKFCESSASEPGEGRSLAEDIRAGKHLKP